MYAYFVPYQLFFNEELEVSYWVKTTKTAVQEHLHLSLATGE
jgi:hypothetical protein